MYVCISNRPKQFFWIGRIEKVLPTTIKARVGSGLFGMDSGEAQAWVGYPLVFSWITNKKILPGRLGFFLKKILNNWTSV